MNKSEMIEHIASETGSTKAEATQAFNAMLGGIEQSLKDGKDVAFVGFGTFSVKDRAGRTGRNPQTGEPIEIKAKKVASFKAGKALSDALN